jgi:hypothetical protein
MFSPYGFQRNPPVGAKNRRKTLLSAKTAFSLDEAPELGENLKLPGFRVFPANSAGVLAPLSSGVFAVWVFRSPEWLRATGDESPIAFQPAGKSESGEAVVFNVEFLLTDPAPLRGAGRGLIAALALR